MALMSSRSTDTPATGTGEQMTEKMVLDYLQRHADFLERHPEILEILVPPEKKMGEKVVDFQHYALDSLQASMKTLKAKFDGLLTSARENQSVQSQVHQAVLKIIRTRDLEHLLEILTMDAVTLFNVDVVRLAMESDLAELYASYYGEQNYSGISFVPTATADQALGSQPVALFADTATDEPYAFDAIFLDCSGLIRSCALLRLELDHLGRSALLAFGVREKGRFHPHQGVELLRFLAQVVEVKLDACLNESEIERLL